MEYFAVTRFNAKTWNENERYREKHNINGACYATPVRIKEKVLYQCKLYVFEMNNDLNLIMGIGIITNTHSKGIKHNIYSNYDYNRYNYSGEIRLSREILCKKNKAFIKLMEILLFKSPTHYKRGYGIQVISDKKLSELDPYISKQNFMIIFKSLFN